MHKFITTITLCLGLSVADIASSQDFYERLLEAPTVVEVLPCFSGRFSDYESWRDFVVDRSHHYDIQGFEERFSYDKYKTYKAQLNCAFFTYMVDGLEIGGYAISRKTDGQRPVVVVNRGGTGAFGSVKFGSLFGRLFDFSLNGYFVIGSQYRGGLGKPEEVGGADEWGGADVSDVVSLAPIVDHMPDADAEVVGMFGASRGTVNAFQALDSFPHVKTVVALGGVYDLDHELEHRPRMNEILAEHIPNFEEDRESELSKRSVIDWVDELSRNMPIFIIHGGYDERATATGALAFAHKLQERFHPYRLSIYERDDHFLSENTGVVDEAILGWFAKYLR